MAFLLVSIVHTAVLWRTRLLTCSQGWIPQSYMLSHAFPQQYLPTQDSSPPSVFSREHLFSSFRFQPQLTSLVSSPQ